MKTLEESLAEIAENLEEIEARADKADDEPWNEHHRLYDTDIPRLIEVIKDFSETMEDGINVGFDHIEWREEAKKALTRATEILGGGE